MTLQKETPRPVEAEESNYAFLLITIEGSQRDYITWLNAHMNADAEVELLDLQALCGEVYELYWEENEFGLLVHFYGSLEVTRDWLKQQGLLHPALSFSLSVTAPSGYLREDLRVWRNVQIVYPFADAGVHSFIFDGEEIDRNITPHRGNPALSQSPLWNGSWLRSNAINLFREALLCLKWEAEDSESSFSELMRNTTLEVVSVPVPALLTEQLEPNTVVCMRVGNPPVDGSGFIQECHYHSEYDYETVTLVTEHEGGFYLMYGQLK